MSNVYLITNRMQLAREREVFDQQQSKNELELAEINDQYNRNKDKMIEHLLEQVMQVQLTVPRVVKQKILSKTGDEDWEAE